MLSYVCMNLKIITLLVWVTIVILSIFEFIESQAVGSNSNVGLLLFPLTLIAIALTSVSLTSFLKKQSVSATQTVPIPPNIRKRSRIKHLFLSYTASAVVSFFTFIFVNVAPWFLGTVPEKDIATFYYAALLASITLFITLCIWVTRKNRPSSPN